MSRWFLPMLCVATLALPQTARGEEVTPAIPAEVEPSEPHTGPAYQVNWEIDIPLLIAPATALLAWPLRDSFAPPHCAPLCDSAPLNAMDSVAAGLYNADWALVSDIGLGVLLGSAVLIPFIDEAPLDAVNDLVVILQSIAWTNATSLLVGMASGRPRPYMYSELASEELRRSPDSAFSFFSSHTGNAFAASTALFQTLRRRHPHSALPWVALAVGDTIALLVAVSRVQAGHHFPTDVIAGAIVGTSLGLLIPALHDQPIQVTPLALPSGGGIALSGRL
jgi:membrane-associated phospholipid phosphatase